MIHTHEHAHEHEHRLQRGLVLDCVPRQSLPGGLLVLGSPLDSRPQRVRHERRETGVDLQMLEELREAFVASVEFSGVIRERRDVAAAPFRELWLLADVKAAGRGWQLAQVQSLS